MQRSKARNSVLANGKNSTGITTASIGLVIRSRSHGGLGQVPTRVQMKISKVTASAMSRLNHSAPSV